MAGVGLGRLLVSQDVELFLTLGEEALEAEGLPYDRPQLLQQIPLPHPLGGQEQELNAEDGKET